MDRQSKIAETFQFGLAPTIIDREEIKRVGWAVVTQPFRITMRKGNNAEGITRDAGLHHGALDHHVALIKSAGVGVEAAPTDVGVFVPHLPGIGISDADDENV